MKKYYEVTLQSTIRFGVMVEADDFASARRAMRKAVKNGAFAEKMKGWTLRNLGGDDFTYFSEEYPLSRKEAENYEYPIFDKEDWNVGSNNGACD